MKYFVFSMLYLQTNGFLQGDMFIYKPFVIKPLSSSVNNLYQVKPYKTIIYYDLNNDKKIEIQDEINKKTNNKYIINTNNIYVSLYNYCDDCGNENKSKCQIFVYVHDIVNNLNGQYILETKEYEQINDQTLITFYENNKIFYTSFSYYKYHLDNVNYLNDIKFDFIYENNQPYLRNINSLCDKINYTPSNIYSSELKYKGVVWKKSNKIIYYRTSFFYKVI